ncbi:MAG TPA: penicillin-binding transpeptidase domain-containing protein [Phycisphaerae bacterium]
MFETRLKILACVLMICAAVVVGRLIELQVVNADVYRRKADQVLLKPAERLPCVRGRILDRTGFVLASDDPDWKVCIDYDVLAMDSESQEKRADSLHKRAASYARQNRYGPGKRRQDVQSLLEADIKRMWEDLARLAGKPQFELRRQAEDICQRVAAVRQVVAARRGFDDTVREEEQPHALIEGLDDQQHIAARLAMEPYPWVSVRSGVHRTYHNAVSLAHVLGRVARVSAGDIENDPDAEQPLRKLLADDMVGRSGVEYLAERDLRGTRGVLLKNRNDEVLERTPAQDGQDARLTIRLDLQDRLYAELERSLQAFPSLASGGAVVVLDIPTRELLALVSYPSYDPNRFTEDYATLRADMRHMPLRFRAVANSYAPGSIVKPLACLAALATGRVTLETTFYCDGVYPRDKSKRCWEVAGLGTRKAHGEQRAEDAIAHSCNVYMYYIGDLLGVDGLTAFFEMVGFGRKGGSGTGLLEDARGINPTRAWLEGRRPVFPNDARNFVIGGGEVSATPVQVVNLVAAYASRVFQPVTLLKRADHSPEWRLPGTDAQWHAIRRGLYRVVNDPNGTAHDYAYIQPSTGYALCGKTGSATTRPWPISYRVNYREHDGRQAFAIVAAGDMGQAMEEFHALHPDIEVTPRDAEVFERWPQVDSLHGDEHAHAWFAGFLQPLDNLRQPDWSRPPRIAFAVLAEFGGSGGRAAGPIAQRVAGAILDVLGPNLDPDAPSRRIARGD